MTIASVKWSLTLLTRSLLLALAFYDLPTGRGSRPLGLRLGPLVRSQFGLFRVRSLVGFSPFSSSADAAAVTLRGKGRAAQRLGFSRCSAEMGFFPLPPWLFPFSARSFRRCTFFLRPSRL